MSEQQGQEDNYTPANAPNCPQDHWVRLKLGATGEISKGNTAVHANALGLFNSPELRMYTKDYIKRYKLKFM